MARLRIISGEFGGRFITAPDGRTTHPMGDRVRSALFNTVDVRDKRVLDAYAGSGALGLEALSRGAAHVDFVERDRRAQNIIAENIMNLDVGDRSKLYKVSISTFLGKIMNDIDEDQKYDLIFIDPPYHIFKSDKDFSTVLDVKKVVKRNGLMVLSYPGRLCVPTVNGVVVVDKPKCYGEAELAIFRLNYKAGDATA